MSLRETRQALMELGIYPSRKHGQTFLVDEEIADREVENAKIGRRDSVLEIGPGLGVLTERISGSCRKLTVIESDPRLVLYLREKFGDAVEVIEGDAMEVDLPQFDVAIGNLPYSVASQLIFRLSDAGMKKGLFMIQREMAQRVVARPFTAEYSRMGAVLQRSYSIDMLFDVGHSHFYPQPDVDSSVLFFRARKGVKRWPEYERAVTLLFSQRRKTIASILRKRVGSGSINFNSMPHGSRRIEELTIDEIEEVVKWMLSAETTAALLQNE
ncbi:MAG: ribosomal RNA small subunit methyltransferase A [Thermoplasmata archaeon]|uniref:Ribosomal RNA small subunit methyltransferase A n=1 Tax=Candidatus Sysuiplasma superficiale TaxID=2823368 RepID=A0A8J7YKU1_9ARCH|nr:ribosomal RNA small subunit methyltransferase A [Candidatus Sysuiplasma superficiale]MBX8644556.1 ribosomal RNA small subunit methyltransferase A [Candidatus Sysuiplasma superficiale]